MKTGLEATLLEILAQKKVRSQTALCSILKEKGIRTDQSTLSRYLKKLGIDKKDGFYHLADKPREGLQLTPVPPNMVVIKTLPGHAQALAFKLDSQPPKGLAGTIAGDDTILCIIENPRYLKSICNQIHLLA